ncbi:MAG TPA: ACP S-malonyltransferase [Coriobacteriia bacterium]
MSIKVALVFPGQGSQSQGMLAADVVSDDLDRLIDAAEALSGLPLRILAASGSPEQLADTRVAQPLLYLSDWAAGRRALAHGLVPAALAGHSLGEYAALACAGVFSVEAGLELVVQRSVLMAETAARTPGGMAAVLGLDADAIREALGHIDGVWIANDNCPGQIVISGAPEGLERASGALTDAGARRVLPLAVAGAFHSPLMAPAATSFAAVLERTHFDDAVIPVLQNTEPTPCTDGAEIRRRLEAQIVSPVRWTETMAALRDAGVSVLLECGPGAVLTGLARRFDGLRGLAIEQTDIGELSAEVGS